MKVRSLVSCHILTDYGSERCAEPGAGILHAGIYGGATG